MGYYTSITGELAIEPPLTYAEFKDTPFTSFTDWSKGGADIYAIAVSEEDKDTPDGVLTVKTAHLVRPYPDEVKAYHAEDGLQRLVDAFPGHEFTGCFEGDGERADDQWRLYVRSGRVIKHVPTITWPDEP
jgi:hypothetical protein